MANQTKNDIEIIDEEENCENITQMKRKDEVTAKQNKDELDSKDLKKKKRIETRTLRRSLRGGAVLSLQDSIESAQTTPKKLANPEQEIKQTLNVNSETSNIASHITTIQTNMKSFCYQSSKAHKQLSLKLYLSNPKVYKMLYNELSLAPVSMLRDVLQNTIISTDKTELFSVYLTQKATSMTSEQKECFLCIGEIKVKPRLYYDITKDIILGLHDIENEFKPTVAVSGLFIIAQGIYEEWKQPVAISYVDNNFNDICLRKWVNKNIRNLKDKGFNVRAIVYNKETDLFSAFPENYFFTRYKIVCFEDILALLKRFYYIFTKYDFIIGDGIAKSQHIVDYYESDIKTQVPITPKLRYKDIKPSSLQELDVKAVMEVINYTTAAGISTYTEFNSLEKSAIYTVELIKNMRQFYDIVTARHDVQSKEKEDIPSELNRIILFFNTIKLITSQLSTSQASDIEKSFELIVQQFNSTIIKLNKLKKILIKEKDDYLPLWRLNSDAVRSFTNQVQKHSKSITKPTAKEVNSIFKQIAVINFLKDTTKFRESVNVENVLCEYLAIIGGFKLLDDNYYFDSSENLIKSSEYNALEMERKDGIIFLSGFLLQMCVKTHRCKALTKYNNKTSCNVENLSMCESIMDDVKKNICVVPSNEFIEFVEAMELVFRNFIYGNETLKESRKVLLPLMGKIGLLATPHICECFPHKYVQNLYVRFRIYHTLKYNNELIRTKNMRRIIVNKL